MIRRAGLLLRLHDGTEIRSHAPTRQPNYAYKQRVTRPNRRLVVSGSPADHRVAPSARSVLLVWGPFIPSFRA